MALRPKALAANNAGTTLLEMLFAITMFTVVFGAIMLLFLTCTNFYNNDSGRDQVNGAALMASRYMETDLRNASAVEASYGGVSTGSSGIVLQAPAYNSGGVIGGEYDQIIYQATPQNGLTRTIVPASGSARPSETNFSIDPNVSSLNFTYTVHDFFTGDGSTKAFTLASPWTLTPLCRVGGTVVSNITYDSSTHSASFASAPAAGSEVEFAYTIDPTNTTALTAVSEVDCDISAKAASNLGGSEQVRASARLRNKT